MERFDGSSLPNENTFAFWWSSIDLKIVIRKTKFDTRLNREIEWLFEWTTERVEEDGMRGRETVKIEID